MGGGPPSFTPDCSCPALLKSHPCCHRPVCYPAVTVSGAAFQAASHKSWSAQCGAAAPPGWSSNPSAARPAGLPRRWFRLPPVRSPLLRGYSLFLGVREMFQFPRCPPPLRRSPPTGGGVAPFGDRRINACSRLPHAYRSYATSFFGTQRRGIHPLLILSSLKEDVVRDHGYSVARAQSRDCAPRSMLACLCTW